MLDQFRTPADELLRVPEDAIARAAAVEAAVCVQANNRLFAVVFWFVVLGPLGPLAAWAYRVTDLVRRRAVFNAARGEEGEASADRIRDAAEALRGTELYIDRDKLPEPDEDEVYHADIVGHSQVETATPTIVTT